MLLCWALQQSNSWQEPGIYASLNRECQLRRRTYTFWGPPSPNNCQQGFKKVPGLQPKEPTQSMSYKITTWRHPSLAKHTFHHEEKKTLVKKWTKDQVWGPRSRYMCRTPSGPRHHFSLSLPLRCCPVLLHAIDELFCLLTFHMELEWSWFCFQPCQFEPYYWAWA